MLFLLIIPLLVTAVIAGPNASPLRVDDDVGLTYLSTADVIEQDITMQIQGLCFQYTGIAYGQVAIPLKFPLLEQQSNVMILRIVAILTSYNDLSVQLSRLNSQDKPDATNCTRNVCNEPVIKGLSWLDIGEFSTKRL